MLVESDARAGLGHDRCERGFADLKRITPQVVPVQLNQVEGVDEGVTVMASVADAVERGNAVVVAGDDFPVDDAGARAQACQRLDDQREATGEVIARTAIEPHTRAPVLRATMRKPSCLISCSHWLPEGSLSVLVGRQGAMNPAGKVRCNMRG
jgi:hypothetical protein